MKRVFITGISGQDGSILAKRFLANGNYEVHGLVRRTSNENLDNLNGFLDYDELVIHRGDILEANRLNRIIRGNSFDYIYHEADQDNVGYSFENPSYSFNVTIQGTLNLLESLPPDCTTKVFIPCSSTMFGPCDEPQTLDTPFNPQSPYAAAKVAVFNLCRIYRQQKRLNLRVGIMYNHDSIYRNGDYLLHRICKSVVQGTKLHLSNPDEKVWIGSAACIMSDVVQAVEDRSDPEFLVGSCSGITLRELVTLARDQLRTAYRTEPKQSIEFWDLPPREGISKVLYPGASLVSYQSTTDYVGLIQSLLVKYGAKKS